IRSTKAVNIRVLAGKTSKFAATADVFAFLESI
nr:hypothetical protein [Tanacetum cinerariifolium]